MFAPRRRGTLDEAAVEQCVLLVWLCRDGRELSW
jgi:hypothetical protein